MNCPAWLGTDTSTPFRNDAFAIVAGLENWLLFRSLALMLRDLCRPQLHFQKPALSLGSSLSA